MRAALPLALLLTGCSLQRGAEEATSAQAAYADANARMHAGMAAIDRDPDAAFMQGMLAHHRGAVEMAQVELQHGRDPEARQLATAIIAAQGEEIARMERWLAAHGKPSLSRAAPTGHSGMAH